MPSDRIIRRGLFVVAFCGKVESPTVPPPTETPKECGHPCEDGSGKVCRRIVAPGLDEHGGGHWYADPSIDGDAARRGIAHWMVTGDLPPAETPKACPTCGGSGSMLYESLVGGDYRQDEPPCDACDGSGIDGGTP